VVWQKCYLEIKTKKKKKKNLSRRLILGRFIIDAMLGRRKRRKELGGYYALWMWSGNVFF